jgi:hypothetical protein
LLAVVTVSDWRKQEGAMILVRLSLGSGHQYCSVRD